MSSYDPNITPLEMAVQNAADWQREMKSSGNEAGVRNAQKAIDTNLDELHLRLELQRYRAKD